LLFGLIQFLEYLAHVRGYSSHGAAIHRVVEKGASFEETILKFQKDVIKKALGEAGGKKAKAAELLKLNKKTLYRKLRSLNI